MPNSPKHSLFSPSQQDNLQYHKEQSELRTVGTSASILLRTWLANNANNVIILRNALCDLVAGKIERNDKLPNYINDLLTQPHTTLTALNQKITDDAIRTKLINTIKTVITEYDETHSTNECSQSEDKKLANKSF